MYSTLVSPEILLISVRPSLSLLKHKGYCTIIVVQPYTVVYIPVGASRASPIEATGVGRSIAVTLDLLVVESADSGISVVI